MTQGRNRRGLDAKLSGAMPARLLAAVVLLGSCGAGLAYTEDPMEVVDKVGRASGFQVRYVKLTGQKETSDSAIVASVSLDPDASIFSVDVDATRDRLESLPWVRSATVRKIFPGTLDVSIDEAAAYSRWRMDNDEVLISEDGTILAYEVPARFRSLPLVAGRRANEKVREINDLLNDFPGFKERTMAALYVNERRWDLKLDSGATIRLPEDEPNEALMRLIDMETQASLLAVGPIVIDMRLHDRTSVQLVPPSKEEMETNKPLNGRPDALPPLDPLAAAIAEAQF
ncbi:FtsQ-type POTRA domain-containing protein [Acuticoccus sp. M5D2P5]|uniref:cell division protein FtsQ/DivIB n=1 Tax=Acuticoccus kalidii TaxID=2910977 RepID=UPI001F33D66B|nr:FtsQ-type POTRA domain-containing protein [Acuticoccus kalidii]